jgi:hypothetical protein
VCTSETYFSDLSRSILYWSNHFRTHESQSQPHALERQPSHDRGWVKCDRLSGNQILGVCGGFAINAFAYLCAFGFVYRVSSSQRHELIGDNEEPSRSAGRTL